MQRHVPSPAEYLAAVPEAQRPLFDHLRQLILATSPNLQESIKWGMLCYSDHGELFALAAQKHYVGLYVLASQAVTDFIEELAEVDHGKGCLRFKKLATLPSNTISRLLTHAFSLQQRNCDQP